MDLGDASDFITVTRSGDSITMKLTRANVKSSGTFVMKFAATDDS